MEHTPSKVFPIHCPAQAKSKYPCNYNSLKNNTICNLRIQPHAFYNYILNKMQFEKLFKIVRNNIKHYSLTNKNKLI